MFESLSYVYSLYSQAFFFLLACTFLFSIQIFIPMFKLCLQVRDLDDWYSELYLRAICTFCMQWCKLVDSALAGDVNKGGITLILKSGEQD